MFHPTYFSLKIGHRDADNVFLCLLLRALILFIIHGPNLVSDIPVRACSAYDTKQVLDFYTFKLENFSNYGKLNCRPNARSH